MTYNEVAKMTPVGKPKVGRLGLVPRTVRESSFVKWGTVICAVITLGILIVQRLLYAGNEFIARTEVEQKETRLRLDLATKESVSTISEAVIRLEGKIDAQGTKIDNLIGAVQAAQKP